MNFFYLYSFYNSYPLMQVTYVSDVWIFLNVVLIVWNVNFSLWQCEANKVYF